MAFLTYAHKFSPYKKNKLSTCARSRSRSLCMTTDSLPNRIRVPTPTEWDLQLASPGKINLFLRIVQRRPDGFHELASLFQSISLHDNLYFSVKTSNDENPEEDTLECDAPGVPTDSSNLVIKALNKYRERTGSCKHFKIRLEKSVPHEAGLGGGSSNAATALWAANQLNGNLCDTQQLVDFGAEFGSDISFFLSSGTAYCTGRGEILENVVPPLPSLPVFIIKPPMGLSTGLVFKNLDLSKSSKEDPKLLLERMQRDVMSAEFVNDLETPSFQLVPRLAVLKQKLYEAGFKVVMMSGSGTSFFCLGEPSDLKSFKTNFASENDVKVFEAVFQGRKSPDVWYFQ